MTNVVLLTIVAISVLATVSMVFVVLKTVKSQKRGDANHHYESFRRHD